MPNRPARWYRSQLVGTAPLDTALRSAYSGYTDTNDRRPRNIPSSPDAPIGTYRGSHANAPGYGARKRLPGVCGRNDCSPPNIPSSPDAPSGRIEGVVRARQDTAPGSGYSEYADGTTAPHRISRVVPTPPSGRIEGVMRARRDTALGSGYSEYADGTTAPPNIPSSLDAPIGTYQGSHG